MVVVAYLLELVSGKWNTVLGLGVQFFWVAGWLTLALLAYFIRDWRSLTMSTSLMGLVALALHWIMPESPKWLFSVGRVGEAEAIVRDIATANGRRLSENWCLKPKEPTKSEDGGEDHETSPSCLDMLRYPGLRTKLVILLFSWFSCSTTYYGLTLNSGDLYGDLLVNYVLNGLMEIPAYAIAIVTLLHCGRRVPFGLSLVLGGLSLLAIGLAHSEDNGSTTLSQTLAVLGKFFVTISFGIIYVYSSELLPTNLRTTGLGLCSFVCRLGGISAGWIGYVVSELNLHRAVNGFTVYAFLAVGAGVLALFLPETRGLPLSDTIEESEARRMLGLREALMLGCKGSKSEAKKVSSRAS